MRQVRSRSTPAGLECHRDLCAAAPASADGHGGTDATGTLLITDETNTAPL
jgi:hypothetical protein